MIFFLLIWLAILATLLVLFTKRRHFGGALSLSYFLSLSLIHVPGALNALDAGLANDPEETSLGFKVTLAGMGMFVLGVIAATRFRRHRFASLAAPIQLPVAWFDAIGLRFVVIGVLMFFVVVPIASEVPSLTAILSPGVGLLIVGIWLWLYADALTNNRRRMVLTLLALPLLPLTTLAFGGFLTFGVQWALTVVAFLYVVVRRRDWLVALAIPVAYVSISVFVAYIGERDAIRDAVWYQQADAGTRWDRITDIVTKFEPLDLQDPRHAGALDRRLNQNYVVGVAVARHEAGVNQLAWGATVPIWILVPRVIWPEKPEIGGGGTVVTDFTGIYFMEGTSVGAGQALEFYVNFGWLGVLAGFFAWGFILMTLDRGIMRALAEADMKGLLLRALPGLSMLSPGGNLSEIMVATVGAIIAAHVVLVVDRKWGLGKMPIAPAVATDLRAGRL